jgi:predicted transcriptional regulator
MEQSLRQFMLTWWWNKRGVLALSPDNVVASRRFRPQAEEARKMIVSVIWSQAGIRYSELARKTRLAHGTLSHHIKILERQKKIRIMRDGGSTSPFPESYEDSLCGAISAVNHPTTMAIMMLLLRHECSYHQIKNVLMKSDSTICGHLKRLRLAGLASRRKRIENRSWIYGIADVNKAVMVLNKGWETWQRTN